jgi:hypothetical protein
LATALAEGIAELTGAAQALSGTVAAPASGPTITVADARPARRGDGRRSRAAGAATPKPATTPKPTKAAKPRTAKERPRAAEPRLSKD